MRRRLRLRLGRRRSHRRYRCGRRINNSEPSTIGAALEAQRTRAIRPRVCPCEPRLKLADEGLGTACLATEERTLVRHRMELRAEREHLAL